MLWAVFCIYLQKLQFIMKRILLLLTVFALASCSASYQAGQQSRSGNNEVAQSDGATTAAKNITTIKGYKPTADDVSRYKNNVGEFLKENVPDFGRFSKARAMQIRDRKSVV